MERMQPCLIPLCILNPSVSEINLAADYCSWHSALITCIECGGNRMCHYVRF